MNRVNSKLWQRFWAIAKLYWFSEEKRGAISLLGLLLLFLLLFNGMTVVLSYINRDLVNALINKDGSKFFRMALLFFGGLVIAAPLSALYKYIQRKLELYWRRWLTNHFLDQYFHNRAFYQINSNPSLDNPDQRISEDIRTFIDTTLGIASTLCFSIIQLISFTGILWSISFPLVIVVFVYAAFGTILTIVLGKRLIGLNFNQLRREADFRFGLVHIREHSESIAFYQGEKQESSEVKRRFSEAIKNFDSLIKWQRNLAFFTNGYTLLIQLLPYLVMAPSFFAGKIQFGVVTQAGQAFASVLQATSVIVNQFESLSAFVAVIDRLATFTEVLEAPTIARQRGEQEETVIDVVEDSHLALKRVTLLTPNYQTRLVKDISVAVQPGEGLLIVGQSGCGKSSLLRAIAGLWNAGTGCIVRPNLEQMLFLPQRPYMILGSLRSQLLYPQNSGEIAEQELYQALQQVNLANLPSRVGGFDTQLDWASILSLGEQQRLAFARLMLTQPGYAILDEATSALDVQNEEHLYQQLHATSTTFISVGHRNSLVQYHQHVLVLGGDSNWEIIPAQKYSLGRV